MKAGVTHQIKNRQIAGVHSYRDVFSAFSVVVSGTGYISFYAGFDYSDMRREDLSPMAIDGTTTLSVTGTKFDFLGWSETDAEGTPIADSGNITVLVPSGVFDMPRPEATVAKFGTQAALNEYLKSFSIGEI